MRTAARVIIALVGCVAAYLPGISISGTISIDGPSMQVKELSSFDMRPVMQLFGSSAALSSSAIGITIPNRANPPITNAAEIFSNTELGTVTFWESLSTPDSGFDIGQPFTQFNPVAVTDDTIVVGQPLALEMSTAFAGEVDIYDLVGGKWNLSQTVLSPEPNMYGEFGNDFSLSGNTLAIGSKRDSAKQQVVYVYQKTGGIWALQTKLSTNEADVSHDISFPVALDANTLVVGQPVALDESGQRTGVAYIYTRTGTSWSAGVRLEASDRESGDWFGAKVAVSGNLIFISAPHKAADTATPDVGRVYVFSPSGSGWRESAEISAPTAHASGFFGSALAPIPGRVVIGESGVSTAYIYRNPSGSAWQRTATITDDADTDFAFSAAASNDTARFVIGAPLDSTSGRAYVFEEDEIFSDGFD